MKGWITKTVSLIGLVLSTSLVADDQVQIQTEKQKFSYTIGYQIGSQLAGQIMNGSIDIDQEAFIRAISDAVAGRPPVLATGEMEESLQTYQMEDEAKQEAAAESGSVRGQMFRDDYSQQEGVMGTASGLQYKIVKKGTGRSPRATDAVVVHYVGRLVDGTIFDSSRDRGTPATFTLDGIILGWQEALQLMIEGDIWEVVIPPELAYGSQGAGASIGPNETLVFEIELITVK